MEEKVCTKCGESLPLNEENFCWVKGKYERFRSHCRGCERKYAKENYKRIIEKEKSIRIRNKERLAMCYRS